MSKHNSKRGFRIEVGHLSESDVKDFIKAIKNGFKTGVPLHYLFEVENQYKRELLVETKKKFKYNPLNITEDYFIPFSEIR